MTWCEGASVVITGAGSGIGRAAALAFADAGAQVAALDLDKQACEETVHLVARANRRSIAIECDVTDENQVASAMEKTASDLGSIDIALNNAGIGGKSGTPTADLPFSEWETLISVNLDSVFLCMKYELKQMQAQRSGVIINMSSTAGVTSAINSGVAYAASKHGVVGLTKTAAKEYLDAGIRINALCPAGVATPLLERTIGAERVDALRRNPKAPVTGPEAIAKTILWLASPAASFCNGQAIVLDGGRVI